MPGIAAVLPAIPLQFLKADHLKLDRVHAVRSGRSERIRPVATAAPAAPIDAPSPPFYTALLQSRECTSCANGSVLKSITS
jgi:hypothetical protein